MKTTITMQVKLSEGELDTELIDDDETWTVGLCLIFRVSEYLTKYNKKRKKDSSMFHNKNPNIVLSNFIKHLMRWKMI